MWQKFRARLQQKERTPSPKEIMQFVRMTDRVLFAPPAVKVRRCSVAALKI